MTNVVMKWILEQSPGDKGESGKKLVCLHIRADECRVGSGLIYSSSLEFYFSFLWLSFMWFSSILLASSGPSFVI